MIARYRGQCACKMLTRSDTRTTFCNIHHRYEKPLIKLLQKEFWPPLTCRQGRKCVGEQLRQSVPSKLWNCALCLLVSGGGCDSCHCHGKQNVSWYALQCSTNEACPKRRLSQATRFCYKPMSRNSRPSLFTNPAFFIQSHKSRTGARTGLLHRMHALSMLRKPGMHLASTVTELGSCGTKVA